MSGRAGTSGYLRQPLGREQPVLPGTHLGLPQVSCGAGGGSARGPGPTEECSLSNLLRRRLQECPLLPLSF